MLKTSISDVRHLGHNADCASSLNPCLDRQNEIIASCRIPNCIEFGTNKNRVIQLLSDSNLVLRFHCIHPAFPVKSDDGYGVNANPLRRNHTMNAVKTADGRFFAWIFVRNAPRLPCDVSPRR